MKTHLPARQIASISYWLSFCWRFTHLDQWLQAARRWNRIDFVVLQLKVKSYIGFKIFEHALHVLLLLNKSRRFL
jgi:hypothetical protein